VGGRGGGGTTKGEEETKTEVSWKGSNKTGVAGEDGRGDDPPHSGAADNRMIPRKSLLEMLF